MSVRHLEMRFSFSSTSVAEACLDRLVRRRSTGWLEISTYAVGTAGHHYRLGRRAVSQADEWAAVGKMLFGPGGALEPYRTRPVFRGSALGPEGCVVLACVERCGPVTTAEVIQMLSTYVVESTVRKRLRLLEAEELIRRRGDEFYVVRGLASAVDDYEKGYDLIDSHVAHHQRLLGESLAFQVELEGGPQIVTLEAALRKLPCFYCKKMPGPEGETVEHFPPRRWGGSDNTSILLPACHGCNQSHGPLIALVEGNVFDEAVSRFAVRIDPSELRGWLTDAMLVAAENYAAAMNHRDVAEAFAVASSPLVSLWAALRRGAGGLTLIDPETGETAVSTEADSSPDVRKFLEPWMGIAEFLIPRPPASSQRRSPKRRGR